MSGFLQGFAAAVAKANATSSFDYAVKSGVPWRLYFADGREQVAVIAGNDKYTIQVPATGGGTQELAKLEIELICPEALTARLQRLLPAKLATPPAESAIPPLRIELRQVVKNRTLFAAMADHEAICFTLLSGRCLSGQVASFTRYEIVLNLESKLPVVILRHALFSAFSPNGRDLLKTAQDRERDWKKSSAWMENSPVTNVEVKAPDAATERT